MLVLAGCRVECTISAGEFPTVMRKSVDHVRDFVVPRCVRPKSAKRQFYVAGHGRTVQQAKDNYNNLIFVVYSSSAQF